MAHSIPSTETVKNFWVSLQRNVHIPRSKKEITDDFFFFILFSIQYLPESKLFHEQTMPDDGLRHDFVISSTALTDPGYADISAIVKIKVPKDALINDGKRQACQGLINANESSNGEFFLMKVGMFFNFSSIFVYNFITRNINSFWNKK